MNKNQKQNTNTTTTKQVHNEFEKGVNPPATLQKPPHPGIKKGNK